MKICTKCKEAKPIESFPTDRSKKSGKGSRCKPCKQADHAMFRKKHGYDYKRYWSNPTAERERHLIKKYGVDLSRYQEMFSDQKGKCAVCGKTQDRAFDVDHDHITGVVRGLLCTSCNRMIGHAGDDPARLIKAAKYLQLSRKSPRSSSEPSLKP